jgi:hypothetical protein
MRTCSISVFESVFLANEGIVMESWCSYWWLAFVKISNM